ncbi:MAG: lamin tail domain-containing protein, partial [Winogradskyella sp.]|nr:lamin tail domain-containing protein [Winogradskyella sp.]
MKKLYFLFLLFLVGSLSFGQVIITELADPNNNSSVNGLRYVELYNTSTSGQDLTGWELRRWTNANATPQGSGIDLSPIGTLAPGAFAIISNDATSFQTTYGFAPDIDAGTGGAADSNGDDQIALFDPADNIVDIFGVPGEDGTGTCHEFEDGRAERGATVTAPNATFNEAEWNVWADSVVNGCTNHMGIAQDAPGIFDPGQWIGASNSCGVVFGSASFTCNSNTIGADNDGVIVNIPYTGSNAGITDVTTTSGGTVGGDDPATTADGVITITGLFEGAAWDITLVGGDCDGITTSGTVDSNECDPSPNTCFDLSTGLELFELVAVATNSDTDQWTESAGTYSMNGFCGSGCLEESNTWLIFGPLDMTSVTDLVLEFDAVEGFDGSDLNIQYTSLYTGCPDGSVWTSA